MNKHLVIGDVHLRFDPHNINYIYAQLENVHSIMSKHNDIRHIIFLGDLFDRRIALPQEVLAFKNFLSSFLGEKTFTLIRGNHDTFYKGENSVETSLALLEDKNVKIVYAGTEEDNLVYIAHFENTETLKQVLGTFRDSINHNTVLLGHFGFTGSLPVDMNDVLDPGMFPCNTILGHIHKHQTITNLRGYEITTLGTPHQVCFSDFEGDYYYCIIDGNKIEIKSHNPLVVFRTLDLDYYETRLEELEKDLLKLKKLNYVKLKLVFSSHISSKEANINFIKARLTELKVPFSVEVKYKAVINPKLELSNSSGVNSSLYLTKDYYETYAKENNTSIDTKILLDTLDEVIN